MNFIRKITVFAITALILCCAILGPGLSIIIRTNESRIIDRIKSETDGNVLVDSIGGNYFSGITLSTVVVYSDRYPDHPPILSIQQSKLRIPIINFLTGNFTPRTVDIDGFNAILQIDSDGEMSMPKWASPSETSSPTALYSGLALKSNSNRKIRIDFSNGVLEIYKKYPGLNDDVSVVFTRLQGSGEHSFHEGSRIDELTGDYLATPITATGFIPADESDEMEIKIDIGETELSTVFRDLEPLFQSGMYTPEGKAKLNIVVSGSRKLPVVTGDLEFDESKFANVKIDRGTASVAYSAGVVDLVGAYANAYGGTIEAAGSINLLSETPLWHIRGKFEKVDIPSYLDSNGYVHSYKLIGNFDGTFDARGDFRGPENLECDFHIASENGKFLSPLSESVIAGKSASDESNLADYDSLNLTAAILDEEINISIFEFFSYDLQVSGSGTLGFDHSIDASGNLTVPIDKARNHSKFGRFLKFLPDSLNRVSLRFTLGGNLEDIKFNPSLGDNLFQGLMDQSGDILNDIGDSIDGID